MKKFNSKVLTYSAILFGTFSVSSDLVAGKELPSDYCLELEDGLRDREVFGELLSWQKRIVSLSELDENLLSRSVGFGPGQYRLKASVNWELLGFDPHGSKLMLIFNDRISKERKNLTHIFFAERSGYGYIVKIANDDVKSKIQLSDSNGRLGINTLCLEK